MRFQILVPSKIANFSQILRNQGTSTRQFPRNPQPSPCHRHCSAIQGRSPGGSKLVDAQNDVFFFYRSAPFHKHTQSTTYIYIYMIYIYIWTYMDICVPRTHLTSLLGGSTFRFMGQIFQNMSHLSSRYIYIHMYLVCFYHTHSEKNRSLNSVRNKSLTFCCSWFLFWLSFSPSPKLPWFPHVRRIKISKSPNSMKVLRIFLALCFHHGWQKSWVIPIKINHWSNLM